MYVDIPSATLHTPSAVKAALEIRLSAEITSITGEEWAITLDEFEYDDGGIFGGADSRHIRILERKSRGTI